MRATARSIALVIASSVPCMPACLGAGDDASVPRPPEAGADGSKDATASDALPTAADTGGDATVAVLTDGANAGADGPGDALPGSDSAGDLATDGTLAPLRTTTSTLAGIRVAHWSPDAPPVDFCIRPQGSGLFEGPFMAALAAPDAGTVGLVFPQVSAYTYKSVADAPKYDVRIIVAGRGTDCSLGGVTVDTVVPADVPDASPMKLMPGATWTVALVGEVQAGDSGTGLKAVPLSDDFVLSPGDGGGLPVALRLVHAAPGLGHISLIYPPPDLGHSDLGWSLGDVSYGNANPLINGNGYLLEPPEAVTKSLVNLRLSTQKAGTPDLLPPATLSAAAGTVVTVVLVGTPPSTGGVLQLLECVDNAGTTNGLSACRVASVSTCGNGKLDPSEECDCGDGLPGHTSTDPQCFNQDGNPLSNGSMGGVCSLSCRLN